MEWASNVCVTLSSNETLSAVGCQIRPIHSCQIEFACSLMLFRQHIMICRSINSWKSKCVTLNKCMALLSLPTTPYYVNTWHWIWAMRQNRPGSNLIKYWSSRWTLMKTGRLTLLSDAPRAKIAPPSHPRCQRSSTTWVRFTWVTHHQRRADIKSCSKMQIYRCQFHWLEIIFVFDRIHTVFAWARDIKQVCLGF